MSARIGMGAAASLALADEAHKPSDCSDLVNCSTVNVASYLSQMREKLMQFVEDKSSWPVDLSDLLTGDDANDFKAFIREIKYIREGEFVSSFILKKKITRGANMKLCGKRQRNRKGDERGDLRDTKRFVFFLANQCCSFFIPLLFLFFT